MVREEGGAVVAEESAAVRTPAEARAAKREKSKIVSTPTVEKIAKNVGDEGVKVKEDVATRSAEIESSPFVKRVLEKVNEETAQEAMMADRVARDAEAIGVAQKMVRSTSKWKAANEARKAAKAAKEEAIKSGKTGRHKEVRQAATKEAAAENALRNEFKDLTPQEGLQTLAKIQGRLHAGEINAETAEQLSRMVDDSVNTTPTNFSWEVDDFNTATQGWFRKLSGMIGDKTFMALMGLSVGAYELFGPEKAEGGMLTSIAKGLSGAVNLPKAEIALIKAAKAARLTGIEVAEDTMVVAAKEFQQGLRGTADSGPVAFIRELPTLMRTIKSDFMGRKMMNPYQWMNMVLPGRANLAINPGVFKASFSMAEYSNTSSMKLVIDNWVRNYPMIKSERNAISKMFEPLLEPMKNQVSFDFALDRVKVLKTEVERLTTNKKLPIDVREAQIDVAKAELEGYEKVVKDLSGSVDKFHKEYQVVAEQAAKQFPQAKLYFALDDTIEFKKYPFMKNLPLSPEEKEIVGIMREQMLHYKARIDELKVPTIKGPYVAHILHPKFNIRETLNQFGGESSRGCLHEFLS